MIHVILGARAECAAALAVFDGVHTWSTPDDPERYAITCNGAEAEAHAAVVGALREVFAGDWTYEARPEVPQCKPCAWCKKRGAYAH